MYDLNENKKINLITAGPSFSSALLEAYIGHTSEDEISDANTFRTSRAELPR